MLENAGISVQEKLLPPIWLADIPSMGMGLRGIGSLNNAGPLIKMAPSLSHLTSTPGSAHPTQPGYLVPSILLLKPMPISVIP